MSDLALSDPFWSSLEWSGLVWYSKTWSGLVWPICCQGSKYMGLLGWFRLVRSGLVWFGLEWSGMAIFSLNWPSLTNNWLNMGCNKVWEEM